MQGYRDRADAGAVLAGELVKYAGQNVAVFGVGSGGVAVAAPIAGALGADLDVLAVRQLALPGRPEQLWAAVAVLGEYVQVVADQSEATLRLEVTDPVNHFRDRDLIELRRLEDAYRAGRPPQRVHGRLVIIVADGLTGLAVMRAAASVVLKHHPARLVVALPAGTVHTCRELGKTANEVICPVSLGLFRSAEPLYADHGDIPVGDIRRLLSA
jgi:putative phosphoribosyl transferase